MARYVGFKEFLKGSYEKSVFDAAVRAEDPWVFHLHGKQVVRAKVLEDQVYDLILHIQGQGEQAVQKTSVKFLYPEDLSDRILPLLKKTDKAIEKKNLPPIVERGRRYFIKNKTLFHLMMEKEVVFLTLLEGEVIRGIITDFSRYDITLSLKGGVPLTVLRHSVYDARNKKGRCFLKSFQNRARDWQKSPFYEV